MPIKPLTAMMCILQGPGNASLPRTRTHNKLRTLDRLFDRFYNCCAGQNILSRSRTPECFGRGKRFGLYQCQPGETHIFHGSCHATDVAWVARMHENDPNIIDCHENYGSRK
jgi:hypothetical protein